MVTPRSVKALAPKIILNAVEGFGKTSTGAYAPDPLLLMARGETGYDTLLSAGRVPSIPADLVETWGDVMGWLETLNADPQGRKTIIFDAMGGFERLCHEYVCQKDFGGEWGERGFGAYQKGFDLSVTEWLRFLHRMEVLNTKYGMTILILGHSRIRPFKNPLGADFDRYVSDCHEKTWNVTARWADAILFGNFLTVVDKEKQGKGKGVGGTSRMLYTERRDAFEAKNRFGMPFEISLDVDDVSQVWPTIIEAMGVNDATA